MKIEDGCVYLAPGSLHLPFYKKLYEQKGNTTGITVLTMEAWIKSQLSYRPASSLELYYQYSSLIANLGEDNMFSKSARDYTFLKEVHSFLVRCALENVTLADLPKDNDQEKDLAKLLEALWDIPLWQREAAAMEFSKADNVRILATEMSEQQRFWADKIVQAGGKIVDDAHANRKYYWSASNPRQEMEAAADAIIANDLQAEDVLAVVSDDSLLDVFQQIFTSRKIPFTLAHPPGYSRVIAQFEAGLEWMMNKTPATLDALLKALYPASKEIRRYQSLFAHGSSLKDMVWRENPLISMADFEDLQKLELQAAAWQPILENIMKWDENSLMDLAREITAQMPHPHPDEVKAFEGVLSAWQSASPWLKQPEDLALLKAHLGTLHPSRSLSSLEGVLVGNRADISCLHDVVFYIGADASSFPGNVASSGLFGEEYLAKLPVKGLDVRMKEHLDMLFDVLSIPQDLYVITAQSDYSGKAIETSHELNLWMNMLPKFQKTPIVDVHLKPDFSLSPKQASDLYIKNGTLKTGLNSLEAYEQCPLQNLLRYGMRLSRPRTARDELACDMSVVTQVMSMASSAGKEYYDLSLEEIHGYVTEAFSFAAQVFPQRKGELESLAWQKSLELQSLFANLKPLSKDWNLDLVKGSVPLSAAGVVQDVQVEIGGNLGSTGHRHLTMNLYEKQEDGYFGLENAPAGTLDFSMQPRPEKKREAFKVSYGRGAAPARAEPQDADSFSQKTREAFLKTSLKAQNFTSVPDKETGKIVAKAPTYEEISAKALEKSASLVEGISQSSFDPGHKENACSRCSFQSICRNGAFERK